MAPHTSSLAFSFLACACALLELLRTRQILLFLFWRVPVPYWGCSAHAKSCFFFSGVYLCPAGGAPHTPNLAFSLTCKHDDFLVLKHPAWIFPFYVKKKYELMMFILWYLCDYLMKAENTFFKSSKVSTRLISLRMDAECGYPAVYHAICVRISRIPYNSPFHSACIAACRSIMA